jgi:hypothetical protein
MSVRLRPAERRYFIGGSDARTIMGNDEAALLRLWREKRGEVEPEDLSGNLIVQLGVVTEPLNRHWFERNTGGGYLRLGDFRKRTPSPPPFSSMNSMPATSIARCSFARASSETRGPNPPSSRLTVGRDSPARSASSD